MTATDRPREPSVSSRLGLTRATEESTAAGVYGLIVSAAVMAASHASTAAAMIVAVLVTLAVYWAAERYSRLVAERIHAGHRPTWRQTRRQLTAGWEMVAASGLPLAVLAVLRLAGVDLWHAVLWAMACATLLLCLAGWEVGRHGQLTTVERLVSTVVAGVFGVALILLKALLH
jgi:hypothetical protein